MGRGRKIGKEESPVAAETNELVQNLKEIVDNDFTDTEIFGVLQECQMNPDEAAQRLLSLDKFHEVKSKRERRKEAQESKVRVIGGESNIELAPAHDRHNVLAEVSKGANTRENPVKAPSVTLLSLSNANTTMNEQPTWDSGRQIVGASALISSSEELGGGFQPAFIGGPQHSGYSSLADVVRLGRPRATVSHTVHETSYTKMDKDSVSLVGELRQNSPLEEVQVCKHDVTSSNQSSNFAESDCSFNGEGCTDKVEDASHSGDGSMEDMAFHNSLRHVNEHQVVSRSLNNGIPATYLSLEKLNLGQEEKEVSSLSKDASTVVLPKCVQALDTDASCLKLCFGTYNACGNTDIPHNTGFNPVKSKMEEASANMHGNSGFSTDPLYGGLSGSKLAADNNKHEFPVSSQMDLCKNWEHESKLEPDSIFYSSPWSAVVHPPSREFYPSNRDLRPSVTQTPLAADESAFLAQSVKDSNSVYSLGRTQPTNRYSDTVSYSASPIIPTELEDLASSFNLPPYTKFYPKPKFPKSMLSTNDPNLSATRYNDLLGAQYNLAMLRQNDNFTVWDYGLGSRTSPAVPDDTYYNRLAQSQPLSTHQYCDNSYYDLNGLDEQLSAYSQGVPDNSYLNVQRQTQLPGILDDRYNRVLPLSQRGLPSSRYQNLQQQLSRSYANFQSRDANAALHYPQVSSPALPQSRVNFTPATAQGGSNQLQMNWPHFY